jgi:hypothetical protein
MNTQPAHTITESDGLAGVAAVCDHYPSDPCTPECAPDPALASPVLSELIKERFGPAAAPDQASPEHRAAIRALFDLQQWILEHPEMPAPTYVNAIIYAPADRFGDMAAAAGATPYGPEQQMQYNVPFPEIVDGVRRSITVAARRKDRPL